MKHFLRGRAFLFLGLFCATVTCAGEDPAAPTTGELKLTPGGDGFAAAVLVTSSNVTLEWAAADDDRTPRERLEYRVVQASNATALTAEQLLEDGEPVTEWTAAVTGAEIGGLTPLASYTFNVVVRDEDDNLASYRPVTVFMLADDAPRVGGDGVLTISAGTASGFQLDWQAASDGETPAADLEYSVVLSTTGAVDTVEHALANGDPVLDWTPNTTSYTVGGLGEAQAYAVNVLVRDATGNIAAYRYKAGSTPDVTPPSFSATPLGFRNVRSRQVTLTWPAATDNGTPANELAYRAFVSDRDDLSSLAAAQTNGREITAGWTTSIAEATAFGLSSEVTYFFNVFARDAAGLVAAATAVSATTLSLEAPTPGAGGTVWLVEAASYSLSVTFAAAAPGDDVLGNRYRVYYAAGSTVPMDTVADVLENGTPATDWSLDVTSAEISGLDSGATYRINVLLKSGADEMAAYNAIVAGTLDLSPPTVTDATLTLTEVTPGWLKVEWVPATDNVTIDLEYAVMVSTESGTVASWPVGSDAIAGSSGWLMAQADDVKSLFAGQTYYANVFVRDAAGNVSAYGVQSATLSSATSIMLYKLTAGVATVEGGLRRSRMDLDNLCGLDPYYFAQAPAGCMSGTTRGFISDSVEDTVRGMAAMYGYPGNVPVTSSSGVVVATSWSALFSSNLQSTIDAAGIASTRYWTFSLATGEYDTNTCPSSIPAGYCHPLEPYCSGPDIPVTSVKGSPTALDGFFLRDDGAAEICAHDTNHLCVCIVQ